MSACLPDGLKGHIWNQRFSRNPTLAGSGGDPGPQGVGTKRLLLTSTNQPSKQLNKQSGNQLTRELLWVVEYGRSFG